MHLSLKISVRTLFGSEVAEDADAVRESVSVAFEFLHNRVWSLANLPLWMPTPGNVRFQRAVAGMDEVVYRIIRNRRKSGVEGSDVLSMLLSVRDAETGEPMPDRQIRDEVVTMLVAGHESTAITLAWTLALLSRHPGIERRVVAELNEVPGRPHPGLHGPAEPALPLHGHQGEHAPLPGLLDVQPHPPGGRRGGRAHHPGRLDPHVLLLRHPPSARLLAQPRGGGPRALHPRALGRRPAYSYFPFGGGARQCIGNRLAEFQIQLMLATLLQRYSMHLVPGRKVEPEATLSLRPKGGLWMTLHERAGVS